MGDAAARARRADHTLVAEHQPLDGVGQAIPKAEQHRQLWAHRRPHAGPAEAEWWQAEHGYLRTALDAFTWPAGRCGPEVGAPPLPLGGAAAGDMATAGAAAGELENSAEVVHTPHRGPRPG